jgi:hypothetical protein
MKHVAANAISAQCTAFLASTYYITHRLPTNVS